MHIYNEDGIERMCMEIVKDACKEYKNAYKHKDFARMNYLEKDYFYSEMFEMHTMGKLDPEALLIGIRQQVDEGINKKYISSRIISKKELNKKGDE